MMLLMVMRVGACVVEADAANVVGDDADNVAVAYDIDDDDDVIASACVSDDTHGDIVASAYVI